VVAALAVVAAVAVRPAVVEVAAAHQARRERMVAHRAARIEQTASETDRPLPAVRAKCSTAPLHVAVAKRGLRRNSMGIDAQAEFDSLL